VTGEQEHIYSSRGLQSFIKHTVRTLQSPATGSSGEHQNTQQSSCHIMYVFTRE